MPRLMAARTVAATSSLVGQISRRKTGWPIWLKLGMHLTQVSAPASAWWGGPPGPRRKPSSACWEDGQGAARVGRGGRGGGGRAPAPHGATDAGYLSQAHSLFGSKPAQVRDADLCGRVASRLR